MGFFSWFSPKNDHVQISDDLIWINKKAKLTAIARLLQERGVEPDSTDPLFLVVHFQNSLDELNSLIEFTSSEKSRIRPIMAERLTELESEIAALDSSQQIDILVAERHPLRSHDDLVLDFAQRQACQCRVNYYLSLDDPLMTKLAGDWVKSMLERLGMTEEEPIESRMVAKRLKQAQEKIARQAAGDTPANSAQEWLELNCPEY